ncbi:hypothetical protein PIB30_095556 [Stylosanthes scabra]|uniref:Uncharacterized protein n=1 Tax=Stylosanthes scabra TaxID=79078 RepID=A0ABU6YW25_9FABA|nr:hypothetical protein [Stylosanthes scabra]
MRPTALRPPRPAGSPSSSVSSGSSGIFHRERERSPRTPLPPPAPLYAPGPVYHVPRTPMTDARRYHSLFSRRRVAPPTPPYPSPPPSDEQPSKGIVDPAAELEGDPDEPYHEDILYPAGYEAYHFDTSYGSERESVSVSSAHSSRHSSDDSSASGSIGYGEASSGSASDCASDDDLLFVNRRIFCCYRYATSRQASHPHCCDPLQVRVGIYSSKPSSVLSSIHWCLLVQSFLGSSFQAPIIVISMYCRHCNGSWASSCCRRLAAGLVGLASSPRVITSNPSPSWCVSVAGGPLQWLPPLLCFVVVTVTV